MAIINTSGFAAKTGAKAFELSPQKKKRAWANNAANTRSFVVKAKPQPKWCRYAWIG
ncbi:hypothetical protein [Marinobacter nauticus]|uniref:Uncharacterized protein n=1 Tax=Marinobacter nauticus TaxID=2743 RepID=A0A833JR71_MARNT|nr:hypothetical protein [Marinobacter nauticus]KAE8546589.1 hypothetical protein F6453_0830 [Marinobacter nauticus]